MNRRHALALASLVLLLPGLTGCGPRKEDAPPKPKVTAEAKNATAEPKADASANATPASTATAMALPKMGAAPKWQLKDVNGNTVTSDQFKGKVVVVDFWATWCPPCRAEIPGYTELQRKYGNDLAIVGVSLDQAGPDVVKDFAAKLNVNYPMVMGDEAIVAAFGGVEALPTTFLIDRSGQVRDRKIGMEETKDYEKKIVAVMKEATGS